MQTSRQASTVALFLCAVMLVPLIIVPENTYVAREEFIHVNSTPFDIVQKVTIGSETGGTDDSITLSVEDGRSITGLDLDITQSALPRVRGESFDDSSSYNSPAVVYDSMNVNSSLLSVLPQGWEWDFESANSSWNLYSGTWFVGFDSTLGQSSGVYSGNQALYSHNGNYPNGMSATHWATSPVMDCSGCSGSWDLKYFRKLSIESSSYDHAYVQVKTSSGNWQNIWSNGGTMNEGTFTQQTHSIGNYIAGNPSFQVRFGIGTTDGSVTYTGWNIDDVVVEPAGGLAGTGEGNWTSPPFGPGDGAQNLRPHGHINFNGLIPSEANFQWSLLDARTNSVIPGFDSLTYQHFDLGIVDSHTHPLLKLKIRMLADASGTPMLDSIDLENNWNDSFMSDPTERGWLLNGMTWSESGLSGIGSATTDSRVFRTGFSAIRNSCILPSGATLHAILSDGEYEVPQTGLLILDKPYHDVEFRISSSNGGIIPKFSVELVQSSAPESLGIDVGSDGILEWGFNQAGMGRYGFQDSLSDGAMWKETYHNQGASSSFDLYLPTSGVDSFSFALNAPTNQLQASSVSILVGGTTAAMESIGTVDGAMTVTVSEQSLNSLNAALANSGDTISNNGIVMSRVLLSLDSSASGTLLFGAISSSYEYDAQLRLTSLNPIVLALNQELGKATASNGMKEIRLPISMKSDGSVGVELLELRTNPSIAAVSIDTTGVYGTMVPSDDWIEVNATFDGSSLGLSNIESDAISGNWDVQLLIQGQTSNSVNTCPIRSLSVEGEISSVCTQSGVNLVWEDQEEFGLIDYESSGRLISVLAKFKLPSSWEDEQSASIAISFITSVGPMLPATISYGLGSSVGIENDVSLKSWGIRTSDGVLVDPSDGQILPGDNVQIEVNLGFEGVDERSKPRTGQVQVNLFADNQLVNSSSIVFDGFESFGFEIPSIGNSIEFRIELISLIDVGIAYEVTRFATFTYDPISPTLMDSSVDQYDHIPSSRKSTFTFSIADRPSLPTNANAFYWRSWIDDFNFDGEMQVSEVNQVELEVPENQTHLIGDYSLTIDTARAEQGDYLSGWLVVSDDAGNLMDGGTFSEPLFNVMISDDGSPRVPLQPMAWDTDSGIWIHPSVTSNLTIPVYDVNGFTDIRSIELDLTSNLAGSDIIQYNVDNDTCQSNSIFIEVLNCSIDGQSDGVFSSFGLLNISLDFDWRYNPDSSLVHKPRIKLEDLQGQSSVTLLEELDWKFSPEVYIDQNHLEFSVNNIEKEINDISVKPLDEIMITGDVRWKRSGLPVEESMEFSMSLGSVSQIFRTNQEFNATITAPLTEGEYPLFIGLIDGPNGVIDRTTDAGILWFVVDGAQPVITEISKPILGEEIKESNFGEIEFEIRIEETNGLNPDSLRLNWAIYPAGSSFGAQSLVEGNTAIEILGARNYGESIPCIAHLDIDSTLEDRQRTRALELRVWVSGYDQSGREINRTFNDLDTPRGSWALEQRVAEFELTELRAIPNRISVGEEVDLSLEIANNGQADGSAALIVELVESGGARTRIHAQNIQVESNSTFIWEGVLTSSRDGTMWVEYQVVEQSMIQSNTVRVDSSGDGLFGSSLSVSPAIFGLVVLTILGLIGLLIYQIRDD